ncbi:MAG: AsnC family transcriptional regulator [Nitrososphaerota archaeon]|nr:AsnC family transcriptional regulator [Nitrososphaerota archaeon]
MDELDVKIFRALMSEGAVAPSNAQVSSSLRSIASRLGADDTTVNYRYRRLKELGALSGWQLMVNPTFFGCRILAVTVDVQPESAKPDMITKLRLLHEVTGIAIYYGRALGALVMYSSEASRSRIVELISRITNAEAPTQIRWALPPCRTERLTETDVSIIRSLSNDARKSLALVAKEFGLSTRTVTTRVRRLRREMTILAVPVLKMGGIPGLIPVYLSYTYAKHEVKKAVDRDMLSHFNAKYFSAQISDPDIGYIFLSASTMADVQEYLEWARTQPGIAGARVDIPTKTMMFPNKLVELLDSRNEKAALQKRAFL